MRKKCILGIMVILLVFCIIGCNGDDDPEIFTVTIGILTNANGSTITASPTSGVEGTEITLTINEDNTYRLKSGTLKYGETVINETTLKFNLPAKNVNITAEFSSFFIGNWEDEFTILTFYANGIFSMFLKSQGTYLIKGIWIPLNNNSVFLTETHFNQRGGVHSINDFTIEDELASDIIINYTYSILTNTTIEGEWILTFIN